MRQVTGIFSSRERAEEARKIVAAARAEAVRR